MKPLFNENTDRSSRLSSRVHNVHSTQTFREEKLHLGEQSIGRIPCGSAVKRAGPGATAGRKCFPRWGWGVGERRMA